MVPQTNGHFRFPFQFLLLVYGQRGGGGAARQRGLWWELIEWRRVCCTAATAVQTGAPSTSVQACTDEDRTFARQIAYADSNPAMIDNSPNHNT